MTARMRSTPQNKRGRISPRAAPRERPPACPLSTGTKGVLRGSTGGPFGPREGGGPEGGVPGGRLRRRSVAGQVARGGDQGRWPGE
eukprot:1041426-Prorocentrum_minimum.AAC.1